MRDLWSVLGTVAERLLARGPRRSPGGPIGPGRPTAPATGALRAARGVTFVYAAVAAGAAWSVSLSVVGSGQSLWTSAPMTQHLASHTLAIADQTPARVMLAPRRNLVAGSQISANIIRLSGITLPVGVAVSPGAEVSVAGGPFRTTPQAADRGEPIIVRALAPPAGQTTTVSLTTGTVTTDWVLESAGTAAYSHQTLSGPWGACSAAQPCDGQGSQSREILCLRSDGRFVAVTACHPSLTPVETRGCPSPAGTSACVPSPALAQGNATQYCAAGSAMRGTCTGFTCPAPYAVQNGACVSTVQSLPVLTVTTTASTPEDTAPVLEARLEYPAAVTLELPLAIGAGTTLDAEDLGPLPGRLILPAGQTLARLSLPVRADRTHEGDETLVVTVAAPAAGATLTAGSLSHTITILNDDPLPAVSLSADAPSVPEDGRVTVTVALDRPSDRAITVPLILGGATQDAAVSASQVTFAPGQTQATLTLSGVADEVYEQPEQVTLTIGALDPARATGAGASLTLPILEDEAEPTVQLALPATLPAMVTEGQTLSVPVTLSGASDRPVRVTLQIADADTEASDLALPALTGSFVPGGPLRLEFGWTALADGLDEDLESFTIVLASVEGARLGVEDRLVVHVVDGDGPPTVTVAGPGTVTEGDTIAFDVVLEGRSAWPVTASWSITPQASAAGELDGALSGTLSWSARETGLRQVVVTSRADLIDELDETVTFRLDGIAFAQPGGSVSATVTVVDDDTATVAVTGPALPVGEGTAARFAVTLSTPSDREIVLPWRVSAPGGAGASAADLSGETTGTLRLAPGTVAAAIDIATVDDALFEAAETLTLSLTTADGERLATATIAASDPLSIAVADASNIQPATPVTRPVTLGPRERPLTVAVTSRSLVGESFTATLLVDGVARGAGPISLDAGASLALSVTASPGDAVARLIDLSIDGAVTTWTVTSGDVTPAPVSFDTIDIAGAGEATEGAAVTPTGFTLPVTVSISGAAGSPGVILGGRRPAVTSGTLAPGESIIPVLTAGPADGTARTAQITVAALAAVPFTVIAHDVTPDDFQFATTTGHLANAFAESNAITVSGITGPTRVEAVPIPGEPEAQPQVSVDNQPYANFATAGPGSRVRARRLIPAGAAPGSQHTMSVTIGATRGAVGLTRSWTATVGGGDPVPSAVTVASTGLALANTAGIEPSLPFTSPELLPVGYDAQAHLVVTASAGTPTVSVDGGPFVSAGVTDAVRLRPGQRFQIQLSAGAHGVAIPVTIRLGRSRSGGVAADHLTTSWTVTSRPLSTAASLSIPAFVGKSTYLTHAESAILRPTGFLDPVGVSATSSDQSRAPIEVNLGGRGWTAPASAGLLSPGETFQVRFRNQYSDGGNRTMTVRLGTGNTVNWVVPTLDQVIDPPNPPPPLRVTGPASSPGWVPQRRGNGTDSVIGENQWLFTVAGLEPGVTVPVPPEVRRVGRYRSGGLSFANADGLRNGDQVGDYVGLPAGVGESYTVTYDFGGYQFSILFLNNGQSKDPLRTWVPTLENAPATGTAYSVWHAPREYGGCMRVDVTSSTCSSLLHIERTTPMCNGAAAPANGATTIYIAESWGDRFRVSANMTQGTGTPKECSANLRYNGNTSWSVANTTWYARTAPVTANLRPSAVPIDGGASHTILWNINQHTPAINGGGPLTRASTGAAYTVPYDAWVTHVSGPDTGAVLQTFYEWSSCNPCRIPPGQGFRFVGAGPPFTPNSTTVVDVCAGDYSKRNLPAGQQDQTCTRFSTTVSDADRDPNGALGFGANVTGAPGQQRVSSATATVANIAAPVTAVILNPDDPGAPRLSVDGGAWVTSASVRNGQGIRLSLQTGPADGSGFTARFQLQGFSGASPVTYTSTPWSVTTLDETPGPISVIDIPSAEPNTWISSTPITISGLGGDTRFTVTGPGGTAQAGLEINGDGNRQTSGVVRSGQTARLWVFTGLGHEQTHAVSLQIAGNPPVAWSVRTRAGDTTPSYALPSLAAVAPNTEVQTGLIEPTDFLDGADVRVLANADGRAFAAGGTLWVSLNGELQTGPFTPGASLGKIYPGQPMRLRLVSGPAAGDVRTVTLDIGGVVRTLSLTTQ